MSSTLPTVTTNSPWTDADTICYPPNVAHARRCRPRCRAPWTAADTAAHPSCTSKSWNDGCTESVNLNGERSINSLADVAQYYYITDLRPTTRRTAGSAEDNVPGIGTDAEADNAPWQHMTTFAVGLGVSGTLSYQAGLQDRRRAGDFDDIRCTASHDQTTCKNWPLWPDPALDLRQQGRVEQPEVDRRLLACRRQRARHSTSAPTTRRGDRRHQEGAVGDRGQAGVRRRGRHVEPEPVAGDNLIYQAATRRELERRRAGAGDQPRRATVRPAASCRPSSGRRRPSCARPRRRPCDNRNIYLFRDSAPTPSWPTSPGTRTAATPPASRSAARPPG